MGLFHYAEREGFEPPDLLQSTVFKTAAIDHSAISPWTKLDKQMDFQKVFSVITIYFLVQSLFTQRFQGFRLLLNVV